MAIRVNFEIGHQAAIRTKRTPEGFTHDWEVFVRGPEGADISHFVDKVVFHLHETFPKPNRVVKEPPYTVKESGYAGFHLPIDIYLKNKDEPKIIKFNYDLSLQQSGPETYNFMTDRYIFQNPNDEFKKKLLKGGGIIVNNQPFYATKDLDRNSRDSLTDEKPQLISKPKLSGEAAKKHKPKEHRDEIARPSNSFERLFGSPIHKPSKVSPEPKKAIVPPKPEKREKDKESKEKDKQKSKHEHKEKEKKTKEEKDRIKEEKVKNHKDAEKAKEKSSKRPSDRLPSPLPVPTKKRCPSPQRRLPSPPSKSNGSIIKEEPKLQKSTLEHFEKPIKVEKEEKPPEPRVEKEKKKKDKKSHDKDKERSSKKEHKKEIHKKEIAKEVSKEMAKPKEIEVKKEREITKDSPVKEVKPPKPEKPFNKFSIENMLKKPEPVHKPPEELKLKEKGESERKHKHKKKDKKREESREKHKEKDKEKKHKHEKQLPKEPPPEPKEPPKQVTPTPIEKERPIKKEPEMASPISIDTSSQCSSKSGKISKARNSIGLEDISASSHSESEGSIAPDDDVDTKYKSKPTTRPPDPPKIEPKPPPQPTPEPERDRSTAGPSEKPPHKEKTKKHKDKKKDGEEKKRRKRKSSSKGEGGDNKVAKIESSKRDTEGSKPSKSETKVQDNGVSSSLGEEADEERSGAEGSDSESGGERRDTTPDAGGLSPDYMLRLKELQRRIMTIKSNEELERVVNLIAETGRYEVTTATFDFDLCLLDRSTVQRLIELIGC